MIHEAIERQIRGACPLGCPDTCTWIVTVKNGEMATLRGDPAHPYTRGALCNKGRRLPDVRPLVRSFAVSHAPYWTQGQWPVHEDFLGRSA